MVVGYFNLIGIPLMPSKIYPPLIVNTDAVLPMAITRELLQAVAGRYSQVFQALSAIQN
jgi:hypothetical protein